MRKKILVIILLLFIGFSSKAQFEVQGTIRPRAEYRNGYKKLRDSTTHAAYFVSQRTRLSFSYTQDKLKTKVSFYDARTWGEQVLKKDVASIGLLEGWAEMELSSRLAIRFGRQMLKYDNARLMSPVNWNQIGAAHDAVLLKYRPESWQFDLGLALSQSNQNLFGTDYTELAHAYKTLNFLWISKILKHASITSFSLMDGYQSLESENTLYLRYTSGLIVKYIHAALNLSGRAFYQGGQNNLGNKVSAWYANAEAGFTIKTSFKPLAGIEIKSGNPVNDSLSKKDQAFNILYGGRHKFNGNMDYFSVPSTSLGAGLVNPFLKFQWIFNPKFNVIASWHYFGLQGNYISNNEYIDKYLGQEIDLNASIKIYDYFKIEGAYSVMLASPSMEIIKGGNRNKLNSWAYAMISVDPFFFKGK